MNLKQMAISIVTLIVGFFTLIFAAVLGFFAFLGAIIASPFIKRKLKKQQQAFEQKRYQQHEVHEINEPLRREKNNNEAEKGTIIDGEYQDITNKK